jgi:AraC-like DNA-binding protein
VAAQRHRLGDPVQLRFVEARERDHGGQHERHGGEVGQPRRFPLSGPRPASAPHPQRWLLHQRVLRARELLETTDEPIERVAHLTGFHNATALRPHFQCAMLCSSLTYRRSFRATRDA